MTSPTPRIEFRRLPEVDPRDLVRLMNHPLVRRHMPLTSDDFDLAGAARFVAGKEELWTTHGYGPLGIYLDGSFAGWGGLQPEGADADLGIVLHPDAWGSGRAIGEEFVRRGFEESGFGSVIVLLPLSRSRALGLTRLGFADDGEADVGGERFLRYRLSRDAWDRARG